MNYMPSMSPNRLPPLECMDLREISRNYLSTCVKSNGLVSVCLKCKDKCVYGRRACDLANGIVSIMPEESQPYENSPLFHARMENEKRRNEANQNEDAEKKTKAIRTADYKKWFVKSLEAPNQVEWVMKEFGLSKQRAKNKIYQVKYSYPDMKALAEKVKKEQVNNATEVKIAEKTLEPDEKYMTNVMEKKLEKLMNEQEACESAIKSYQEKLAKIKDQIDTICKTIDILRDT